MSDLISISPSVLFGLQETGPSSFNSPGEGAQFAARLWHKFIEAISQAGAPMDREMYGVSWPADDHTPPQSVHYFCGVDFPIDFEGVQRLELDGGNYFSYLCEVPADDLDQAFQQAYLDALPKSGLTPRDGQHLEIYGDEYDPTSPIARFRILIPVQG